MSRRHGTCALSMASGHVKACTEWTSATVLCSRLSLSHALNQCSYCVSFQDMIISGLQPETSYSLTVTAYTTKGDGARSKPKLVSTTGAGNVFCADLHLQPYFSFSDGMDLIYHFFLMMHWKEIKCCDQLWSICLSWVGRRRSKYINFQITLHSYSTSPSLSTNYVPTTFYSTR